MDSQPCLDSWQRLQMSLERKIGWASLSGPALSLLMWGAAGLGWVPPVFAYYFAVCVGGLGTVIFGSVWLHIGWTWLRSRGVQLGPAIFIALGLAIACGGLVWAAITWKPVSAVGETKISPMFEVENLLFVPASDHHELTVAIQNNGTVSSTAPVWGIQVIAEGNQPSNAEALNALNSMTPSIAAELSNARALVEVRPGEKIMVGDRYKIPAVTWSDMIAGKTRLNIFVVLAYLREGKIVIHQFCGSQGNEGKYYLCANRSFEFAGSQP